MEKKERSKWSLRILKAETAVGAIAVVLGIILTVLVWGEGYFVGAMMLIVTGMISLFLGVKELVSPSDHLQMQWMPLMFKIVRRTFLFLNLMLSLLVVGTLASLL